MMNEQFGNPSFLGKAMSSARGRFRTYLKKQARRAPIAIAIAIVLALGIRATVAEAFYVPSDSVSPLIPKGSRCVVNKLASDFRPGDVIVYRPSEKPESRFLAIIQGTDAASGDLLAARNNKPGLRIPRSAVVGRVFLNTR